MGQNTNEETRIILLGIYKKDYKSKSRTRAGIVWSKTIPPANLLSFQTNFRPLLGLQRNLPRSSKNTTIIQEVSGEVHFLIVSYRVSHPYLKGYQIRTYHSLTLQHSPRRQSTTRQYSMETVEELSQLKTILILKYQNTRFFLKTPLARL